MSSFSEENIYNQALKNHKEKKIKKAFELYKKVLQINPTHYNSLTNIGNIFFSVKNFKNSRDCFKKLIHENPNDEHALNKLGLIFFELGDYVKALEYFYKLKLINQNYPYLRYNLLCILKLNKIIEFKKNHFELITQLIIFLFKHNDIHHDLLSKNAINFLLQESISSINFDDKDTLILNKNIKILINQELFHLILQKSLITEIFIEKIIVKLRTEILFMLFDNNRFQLNQYKNFIISLAEQSWLNEFVYTQSKKEKELIYKLQTNLKKDFEVNELEIAILGCYMPLNQHTVVKKKLAKYTSQNKLFNDLITVQIKEPDNELALKKNIDSIGLINNTTSQKVRQQYEENPYPRWRYFNLLSSAIDFIDDFNAQIYPNQIILNRKFNSPKILLAGCGTGQHLLALTKYKNAKILAIDLSLSSICYAKRKIEELNIKNVEFLHADILELNKLNEKFDIIESAGTLHHMKNPIEGLKILLNLLENDGLLRLGLYSKIARREIIKFRKTFPSHNFLDEVEDIKNFRKKIIDENSHYLLNKALLNRDFFSTSNLRDLLFHVQEHQFLIPEISKIIEDFDLEFLGFVFSNKSIKQNYFKNFDKDIKNTNLINWNKFELKNPNIFKSMYQFWIKKN